MKDWQARLDALAPKLEDWERRYAAEHDRLLRARRPRFSFKPLSEAELADVARQATLNVGEAELREGYALLDELGPHYLQALPQERAAIRARCGARPELSNLIWSYAAGTPDVLRGPEDEPRLELALTALSIDDLRADIDDVRALLGDLWVAAARVGLDPRPALAKVVAASNRSMAGGGGEMRELLEEFPTSTWFRDHVRPRLKAAAS